MALETLKGIHQIGGFNVTRGKPELMTWDDFDKHRVFYPILITDKQNMISFKIQNGPIKEVGVNGCQVDTLIEAAKLIIEELNEKFPCIENYAAIQMLSLALDWLEARKRDREKRCVEGMSHE